MRFPAGQAFGRIAAGICVCALAPGLASAQVDAPVGSAREPDGVQADASAEAEGVSRPLAAVLSFVPGILLNGSGQFALGKRDTAYRLFAMQGMGAGLILLGALPLGLTAASRYLTGPGAMLAVTGMSFASTAWFADVYSTLLPLDLRGEPELRLPHLEAELGYRYVLAAPLSYGNVVVNRLSLRWASWHLEPAAWLAIDGSNIRLRALVGYRYFGPRPGPAPRARDGSSLDLDVAVTSHRFPAERFAVTTGEIFPHGRLDLAVLSPELRGAFSELGLGVGLERFDYQLGSEREVPGDYSWLLLARFGFGIYLGGAALPRGEMLLYYDHRHDDFAAGIDQAFVGIAGHVGLDAELYLSEQLGVRTEVEVGGATMAGLSLLVREQVTP